MARWTGEAEIVDVLAAAAAWRERCIVNDGSVLTDAALWTLTNVDDLHRRFTEHPIEGSDQTFFEKLKVQLDTAAPAVKQLAAEVVWLLLLFPHADKMQPTTKRSRITEVWGWSGTELQPNTPYLEDASLHGVGYPGTAYMTGIWAEFGFALEFARRWKALPAEQRHLEMNEVGAWRFGDWMDQIEGADRRPIRNAIAYFLYPDFFERNLSRNHRLSIYNALKGKLPIGERPRGVEPSLIDLDRAILRIRRVLEDLLGTADIDFYVAPLHAMWNGDARDERRKQVASALEGVLSNYNLELHQTGSKKKLLENTRPTSEATGYWQNPNDATNKPLRWLIHLDLTDGLDARIPDLHGSKRIAFLNAAQGRSGAVLVRIVPAIKLDDGRFEFFETWEWLLLIGFLPALPVGSAAQLLENFDPTTGTIDYKGQRHPYIGAALIALNDDDAVYIARVGGMVRQITYREATAALADLLHVDPPFGPVDAVAAQGDQADAE